MAPRFSRVEQAFLLSYTDYCIAYEHDYKQTVARELKRATRRTAMWSSIHDKLKDLLSIYGKPGGTTLEDLLQAGTVSLNIQRIQADVKKQMEDHLAEWQLGPLGVAAVATSSPAASSESDTPTVDENEVASVIESAEHQEDSAGQKVAPQVPDSATDSEKARRLSTTPGNSVEIRDSEDADQGAHMSSSADSTAPSASHRMRTAAKTTQPTSKMRASRAKTPVHYAESSSPSPTPIAQKRTTEKRKAAHEPEVDSSSKRRKTVATSQAGAKVAAGKRKATEEVRDTIPNKKLKTKSTDRSTNLGSLEKQLDNIDEAHTALQTQLDNVVNDNETIKTQLNAVIGINSALLIHYQTSAGGVSEQLVRNLQNNIRQVQQIPDKAFQNMANDALAEGKNLISLRELLKTIIVEWNPVNNGNRFPKVPQLFEHNEGWKELREAIAWTVGHDNDTPLPTPLAAAFLTARIEDIANGRIPDTELESCIRGLRKHLVSPHALQLLLSALLCRLVFQSPEPLLEGEHTKGWMKLYEAFAVNNGLDAVQQLDKIALKRLFQDETIQSNLTKRRAEKIADDFTKIAKEIVPPAKKGGPRPRDPRNWATRAMAFKKELMLSPVDYRIHYVEPGTTFDPLLMKAVDARNFDIRDDEVEGKEVVICLFPALEQTDPQPFNEKSSVDDALAKNKRFFPNFIEKEAFIPTERMSRATVLVL